MSLSDKMRVLLSKASKYSGLYSNPDFQDWKREVVDKRLESLAKSSLSAEAGTPEQIRIQLRYQELKYITEDIFRIMKQTEDRLRKRKKEEV